MPMAGIKRLDAGTHSNVRHQVAADVDNRDLRPAR
jgi:hypothetical protein